MGRNYYNEIDPFAAEWLRNLIAAGEIPAGDVDTRSIKEVQPDDLDGYTQCHFFAGIGGWSLALRLAGWPDDVPIWTGSCPCQPFSAAGKRKGTADDRHLWPEWFRLIRARNPPTTTGEQVASKDGRRWLAGVRTNMEALGNDFGAADLCAPWVRAPHLRQRLYWLAHSRSAEREWCKSHGREGLSLHPADGCGNGRLADSSSQRIREFGCLSNGGAEAGVQATYGERQRLRFDAGDGGSRTGRMADSNRIEFGGQQPRLEGHRGHVDDGNKPGRFSADQDGSVAAPGAWLPFRVVHCRDGKARRVPTAQSGVQPLAYGVPRGMGRSLSRNARMGPVAKLAGRNRVGRLKGYGNAIVPQVAAEFIRAYMECG